LIVEEYGPTNIVYLPSKHNIIADALSHLPKLKEPHDKSTFLEEIFTFDKQLSAFPNAFDVISKAQLTNNKIQQRITNNNPDFETRIIQRAPLVYFKGKLQSLSAFDPMYSPGITKTYFIQEPTECSIPTFNMSLGPDYAHKLKTLSNIATLANITRHKERNNDKYLFKTSHKSLTHGTQFPSTHNQTMDHSTVTTFFKIKRAYNTSSPYNH
jgi:hypothetical protein